MTHNSESSITLDASGRPVSYTGPDAVEVFRAKTIASGLQLWHKTGIRPNRHWTPTAMIQAAGRITHKQYKINKKSVPFIVADLNLWINTMISALPINQRS